MKLGTSVIVTSLLLAAVAPAMAHHSFAMFDLNPKSVKTVTGTVKELEWINPHAWIHVMVKNKAGVAEEWSFEMGSVGQLSSKGWKKDIVAPGDTITITFHPLKDGTNGGNQITAKLPNGTVLGGQPTTGR